MNLKTYQANTMSQALASVKQDLGRDAVILHTRSFRKGGLLGLGGRRMWEITAAPHLNVPSRAMRGQYVSSESGPSEVAVCEPTNESAAEIVKNNHVAAGIQ